MQAQRTTIMRFHSNLADAVMEEIIRLKIQWSSISKMIQDAKLHRNIVSCLPMKSKVRHWFSIVWLIDFALLPSTIYQWNRTCSMYSEVKFAKGLYWTSVFHLQNGWWSEGKAFGLNSCKYMHTIAIYSAKLFMTNNDNTLTIQYDSIKEHVWLFNLTSKRKTVLYHA